MFGNKIFISYSSYKIGEAKVVREFFNNNDFEVIMDKDEKESFIHFMDRINECKYVIMILNNSFFESAYCMYEVIKCFSKHKKIFPIYMNELEIEDREKRKVYYEKIIEQKSRMNILSKDKKKFDNALESFDKFDDIVNRLLAIVKYPEKEKTIVNACNEIYFRIKKKAAKNRIVENEFEIRSRYLPGIEKITDSYSDFVFFLGDIMRCSSFVTSLYPEDVPGEKEWKYKSHQVERSSLGYIILVNAIGMDGEEEIIQFTNVSEIEFNNSDLGSDYLKYYVVEKDINLQREYARQMKRPENIRDKDLIEKYLKYSTRRHRVKMNFKDGNALDNMAFG